MEQVDAEVRVGFALREKIIPEEQAQMKARNSALAQGQAGKGGQPLKSVK